MYLDSRPLSTFQHASSWSMPTTPQPPETLKRPPIVNATGSSSSLASRPPIERPSLTPNSSNSSLGGLEQHVPSFQSFIKRTPSVDSEREKPLPPTPLEQKRRRNSFTSLTDVINRRSSSVYSRTPSQFIPEIPEWKLEDPDADSPLLLRPVAYRASSPDLSTNSQISAPFLLEPRTFSPLIESPRTTTVASSSPPQSRTQSMLAVIRITAPSDIPAPAAAPTLAPASAPPVRPLPPIDTQVQQAKSTLTSPLMDPGPRRQPVKTVSLEKAKEAMNAPGAIRLLPEELRAQALKKVKSQGHVRLESVHMFGASQKSPLPPAIPTMIDPQGRKRTLLTPPTVETPRPEYGFPSPALPKTSPAYNAFHVGTGPVREMVPPPVDRLSETRTPWRQVSQNSLDEPRGRALERKPYESNQRAYPNTSSNDRQAPAGQRQSQYLANEYHSLLSQQQHRQASQSPGYSSDDSIRTHMKMVPQPLFGAKQPPRSRSDSSRNSQSDVSPFNHKRGRGDGSTSSANRSTGFGLRLSLETSGSKERITSTTGMIPISPPTDMEVKRPKQPQFDPSQWQPNPRKGKNHNREKSRESAFYPHIMRRKVSKKDEANLPPIPGNPLLAAEIIAKKLMTPDSTPDTSPMQSSPIVATNATARKLSSAAGSEKEKKKFYQRFGKSRRLSSTISTTQEASPTSPHLFPSPVKTTNTIIHLGWSDHSKKTFDESRSPPSTPRGGPPRLTHIQAPMRPKDDSKSGLAGEPESPTGARRPSLFAGVLDSWRENKAAKRREDLKRLIRVVPVEEGGDGEKVKEEAKRRSSFLPESVGVNSLLPRRMSTYGWM